MRRQIYAAVGVIALSGFAARAQTPATPQSPSTMQNTQQVTVTGCVQSWSGSGSSSSAPSATTPAPTGQPSMADVRYRLTDVEKKDSASMGRPGSATPGTAGTTGTTAPAGSMSRGEGGMGHDEYLLRADTSSVNLAEHLNHKVEVTGRVAAAMSHSTMGATGTTGTAGTPGTPGTMGTPGTTGTTAATTGTTGSSAMGSNSPVLTVSSIKTIASSCK